MEALAESLRNSQSYHGIKIGNKEYKLSIFADDMALFVSDPECSLQEIYCILDTFQSISGLKTNKDKSLIYPITIDGLHKEALSKHFQCAWTKDVWKYLGVSIPINFSTFSKRNLEAVHSEVRSTLKSWNDKFMSLLERISAVRSFIFPKFLFLFRTAPLNITRSQLLSWQRTFMDFIWSFKKPRLPRRRLMASKAEGGLAAPNLLL